MEGGGGAGDSCGREGLERIVGMITGTLKIMTKRETSVFASVRKAGSAITLVEEEAGSLTTFAKCNEASRE